MRKEFIIPKVDKSNYFRASELLEYIYNNPKKCQKELEEFNSYRNGIIDENDKFGIIDVEYFVEEYDFDFFETAEEMLKPFPPEVENLTTREVTFLLNKIYDYLEEEDIEKANYYITLLDVSLNLMLKMNLEEYIYSRKYTIPQIIKIMKENGNPRTPIVD